MTTPTSNVNINGVVIPNDRLAQLNQQGYTKDALARMSSAQLQSLLSGGGNVANPSALGASGGLLGSLTANTSAALTPNNSIFQGQLMQANAGMFNNGLQNSLTLNPNAAGFNPMMLGGMNNMSAQQAIAAFEQMSGGYLTQSGLNLNGIMGNGMYSPMGIASMNPSDRKFMLGMSTLSNFAPALAGLFTGLASKISGDNNSVQGVNPNGAVNAPAGVASGRANSANPTAPQVTTGITAGLDNAINYVKTNGRVTDAIRAELQSSQATLRNIDASITSLESEVSQLAQKANQAKQQYQGLASQVNKLDSQKQDKMNEYESASLAYSEAQALADDKKNAYEMAPDEITDANGNRVKNPNKDTLKQQWQQAQQQAEQAKQRRDQLKQQVDADPQMKGMAGQYDQIFDVVSQYEMKQNDLQERKQFRTTLVAKINELSALVSRGTGSASGT